MKWSPMVLFNLRKYFCVFLFSSHSVFASKVKKTKDTSTLRYNPRHKAIENLSWDHQNPNDDNSISTASPPRYLARSGGSPSCVGWSRHERWSVCVGFLFTTIRHIRHTFKTHERPQSDLKSVCNFRWTHQTCQIMIESQNVNTPICRDQQTAHELNVADWYLVTSFSPK